MMWVAIASAIMFGSGGADDFGGIQRVLDVFAAAVQEVVDDPGRRAEALIALDITGRAVATSKQGSLDVDTCLDGLDGDYHATREDYAACAAVYEGVLDQVAEDYVASRARFEAAVPREDWPAINRIVAERLAQ